jgi:HK97 family phage major capsid protein
MTNMKKSLEGIIKLSRRVQELQKAGLDDREIEDKVGRDLSALNADLRSEEPGQRVPFSEEDARAGGGSVRDIKGLEACLARTPRNDEERELHSICDRLLFARQLLQKEPTRMRRIEEQLRDSHPALRRAIDTSGAADWIPEVVSGQLHLEVRNEMVVASLLEQTSMTARTVKVPVEGSDADAYKMPERSDPDDAVDDTKFIPSSQNLTFPHIELTAKKIAARMGYSTELVEDSIVSGNDYIRSKIVRAISSAVETALINGKESGSHFDADVTASNDRRKLWDGFRQQASDASMGNGAAVFAASAAGSLDIADVRKLRMEMGKYATRPRDCFFLTSNLGWFKLLSLKDGNNVSPVLTLDKLGSLATIVRGTIGAVDGIPIVTSDFVRDDLNHAGVYDGVTTDSTLLMLVNRREWTFGMRRDLTVKAADHIAIDAIEVVATMRGDAKPYHPTRAICGYTYDVRK